MTKMKLDVAVVARVPEGLGERCQSPTCTLVRYAHDRTSVSILKASAGPEWEKCELTFKKNAFGVEE